MELVICVGRFANAGVVGLRTNMLDRLMGVWAKCNLMTVGVLSWSVILVRVKTCFFYCQSPEIVTVIEE